MFGPVTASQRWWFVKRSFEASREAAGEVSIFFALTAAAAWFSMVVAVDYVRAIEVNARLPSFASSQAHSGDRKISDAVAAGENIVATATPARWESEARKSDLPLPRAWARQSVVAPEFCAPGVDALK